MEQRDKTDQIEYTDYNDEPDEQEEGAGVAQLVRASAFQAEGRGFESRFPLQKSERVKSCPLQKPERVKTSPAPGAYVAQSVEHVLGKDEASGSIPLVGSINIKTEVLYG